MGSRVGAKIASKSLVTYCDHILREFQSGIQPAKNKSDPTALPIYLHMEKYFRKLIKSNRNQIVYTIFQLIWNQTDVCFVPNQSEGGEYNLIPVLFNEISAIFLRVLGLGHHV